MDTVQLSDAAGRGWIRLRAGDVHARGYVQPRLVVYLYAATTRERQWAEIHLLRGKLTFDNEQLGEGLLSGESLNYGERSIALEIPVDRAALQYVTDRAGGDRVDLALDIEGWMHVRRDSADDDPAVYQETPTPGHWGFLPFGRGSQTRLDLWIARSDWFTRVMEPVGTLSYIVTEIPVPKGSTAGEFLAALNHLREAESKYATGDDAEVFFRCRAALEVLPGAPKNIFNSLPDQAEAKCMDAMMAEVVGYLHRGRHPQRQGEQRGDFGVDHADAGFALALTRLLVAQTSRLLSRGAS
jgi:hypothetical protein